LLPRNKMEGFDHAAGLFSRVYFRDVLYPMLRQEWDSIAWADSARCHVPVGATLTRLVPERVVLGDQLVSAYNQRWASTFTVTTRRDTTTGKLVPVFLARPHDDDTSSMGTVAIPIAGPDNVMQPVRVFDIFAASSGYPLAFGP